jgi:predicted flavoprotein YhiN
LKNRIIDTDVLIIGGGTAGCFAGITLGGKKDLDVLIVEKANIVRSGCLAAGVNAINAYITKGRVPQDYVDSGEMQMALALYPVSMQQIIRIADSGNIMPPKATWFEPKLRSGLLVYKY